MSATTMERAGVLSGRQMVMFVVVGLHALVIGALMSMSITFDAPDPPGFKPLTSVAPVEPVPPKPKLKVDSDESVLKVPWPKPARPIIGSDEVPRVPADLELAVQPGGEVIEGIGDGARLVAPTELEMRATRSPDDYYPAVSLQLQEEGLSVVRICVGPAGRLEGRPTVVQGSGSRRLDAAAIKWASEALTFTAATRNGATVFACRDYRVRFTLR